MRRRILSFILAIALILMMLPATTFEVQAATSGKCGKNLTYTLDDAGKLTISGTGKLYCDFFLAMGQLNQLLFQMV